MASRPILSPHDVIVNGDMSADIISDITVIQTNSQISYDISWSGTTPVGTLSVQVSNTYEQNSDGSLRSVGNWVDLPLSTTPSVSGDTGNGFIDILVSSAYAIRLMYTSTSGTGLMQATICGKVS